MTLQIGTAKMDITPHQSIPLAGFGFRKGEFEQVHLPIHLRIIYFQPSEVDSNRLIFVSGDLLWWDSEEVEGLKETIQQRWGVKKECIFFCATHSHSGPQTSSEFPLVGQLDENYLSWLKDQLWMGIKMSKENLEPVIAQQGIGQSNIGVFRRKCINGQIEMAPNYDTNIDQEVMVVQFITEQNITKALIVNFACHPTTTSDNAVSSEYTGFAMDQIEAKLEGNAISLFLQGCCGDIRPNLVENDQFFRGNHQDVIRLGTKLSEAVFYVLNQPMKALKLDSFRSKRVHINLPLQLVPDKQQLEAILLSENPLMTKWAKLLLAEPHRMASTRKLEISIINLFQNYTLITMNGEMVSEYGNFIKSLAVGEQNFMPIGYCNGMIGYVPTSMQLEEGGYESVNSIYPFGLPAPFEDKIEEMIKSEIHSLIV